MRYCWHNQKWILQVEKMILLWRKEAHVISDNHLNRNLQASKLDETWGKDITYLIFNGQRLYLSAIKAMKSFLETP